MRLSILNQLQQRSGFTLIEVIVVGVLTIFVAIFGFTAYYTMTNTEIYNESQIRAVNLTQKVMEAVESQANINFDTLSTTAITGILADDGIPNNQAMTSGMFTGFTVNSVELPTANAQVKQIDVSVSWAIQGQSGSTFMTFMVTRPAANLPGDIAGTVTDSSSEVPVVGAQVQVCYLNNPANLSDPSNKSLCFTTTTNVNGYYSFQNPTTLAFTLKPGKWELTATQTNYEPYTDPSPVEVFSGEQTTYNFTMVHNPQPGKIVVDVQDQNTGDELNSFVALYQNGSPATTSALAVQPYSYTTPATFTIPFNVNNANLAVCFTVNTGWTGTWYPFGYAAGPLDATIKSLPVVSKASPGYPNPPAGYQTTPPFVSQYDLGYSQNACASYTYSKPYDYRGWSSAVYTANGLNCLNGQYGFQGGMSYGKQTDTECVYAGQTLNVKAKLIKNPTATLKGQVTYNDSVTPEIHGGTVTAYWGPLTPGYDAQGPYGIAYTTLDPSGKYQLTIPASQSLFPNSEGYWMGIVVCGMGYNETFTPWRWEMLCSPAYTNNKAPWTIYDNGQMQDMSVWSTSTSPNSVSVDAATPPANASGVFPGDVITKNVEIDDVAPILPGPPPIGCWSIVGKVIDASTGGPLVGATVSLPTYNKTYTTDATGSYSDCISSFDSTNGLSCETNCPTSLWTVTDTHTTGTAPTGYYPYNSSQTAWYISKTTATPLGPDPATNTGFTFPTIYLLPENTGVIKVIVQHPGTYNGQYPFGGLQVTLTQVDGTNLIGTSNAVTGEVDFPNALTTPANAPVYYSWPDGSYPGEVSPSVPLSAFNQNAITISISVAPPNNNYYPASQGNITLKKTNTPLTIYITVQKIPGA